MTTNISKELMLQSKHVENEKKYWLNKLSGELVKTYLPCDNIAPNVSTGKIVDFQFRITGDLFSKLIQLTKGSDNNLYIILLACLTVLLNKYTGNKDIIIAAPIYKQEIDGEFINTALAIRLQLTGKESGKELILLCKKTVFEANEHLNFPIERFVNDLELPFSGDGSSLFEIGALLENIHYKKYIKHLGLNVLLSFLKTEECINGVFQYNPCLYKKDTIDRIVGHFICLLQKILNKLDIQVSEIEILSEEERHRLLIIFNETKREFPKDRTIHKLFEEQVEKRRENTAVVGDEFAGFLSYTELNKKSNQLARILREKGINAGTIVGIMAMPSIQTVIGILAVLKAGGAYLPIDPESPLERINFMLKDSQTHLILTSPHTLEQLTPNCELIDIHDDTIYNGDGSNLKDISTPGDIMYVIYTSGTSGRPKSVMLKNENMVNYISWFLKKAGLAEKDKALLISSFAFDLGYTSVYSSILVGGELHVMPKETFLSTERLLYYLRVNAITYIKLTPSLFSVITNSPDFSKEKWTSLRLVVLGGEPINTQDVANARLVCDHLQIMNHYGPTETTVGSIAQFIDFDRFEEYIQKPTIGKPIDNTEIYILDENLRPVPVGIPAELYIGGNGVGIGYLNQPELTSRKFTTNPFNGISRIYQTGDLARWAPDGYMEFLGRIDSQVKIRGFRIELEEIENQLLEHESIKNTVVIAREDENGGKYLCAYYISLDPIKTFALREYLTLKLPYYMIPSFFIALDKIPVTPNGKVDRRALPEPELGNKIDYMPPQDDQQEKLVVLWSKVLGIEKESISIDANFFELGGDSLKATSLIAKIHKERDIQIPLFELFKSPTIRGISEIISRSLEDKYTSIEPAEEKEFYPLSSIQKRIYILQQIGNENTSYNVPSILSIKGEVELNRINEVYKKLIARHESLRTSFIMVNEELVQRIHKKVEFGIRYYEALPGNQELEDVVQNFVRPFDMSCAPLMRAGLIKTGEKKYLFYIDMHHIVRDATSISILNNEFMALYAGEELPPLRLYYKDYSEWQNSQWMQEKLKLQRKYWQQEFLDEIPVLNLPTNYPRPTNQSFEGNSILFELSETETMLLNEIARSEGTTLFMLLLALFYVFLCKISSQEDIVVGTPIAARTHVDLGKIIGMLVNTLVIRNFIPQQSSFKEFLNDVKYKTLKAYDNQDYPFEDLVENVLIKRDLSRNPMFDVMFVLLNVSDDPEYVSPRRVKNLTIANYPFKNRTSKFDLTLFSVEKGEKLCFLMEYCTKLFKEETILRFAQYFNKIISSVIEYPEKRISDIEIISDEEKKKILYDFNDTEAEYPKGKTIHRLFEEQVVRTPDNITVVAPSIGPNHESPPHITYKELNEKSNQLAYLLREMGTKPNAVVGLMVKRSIEMIIGIMGILKSGGAYLPIDPHYPQKRIEFMLADSAAKFLVTMQTPPHTAGQGWEGEKILLDVIYNVNSSIVRGNTGNQNANIQPAALPRRSQPGSLLYVIYTSGSTGKPKGVMLMHRNLVNLIWYQYNHTEIDFSRVLQFTTISFDVSAQEIFSTLLAGGHLSLVNKETLGNIPELFKMVLKENIKTVFLPASFLKFVMNEENYVKMIPGCLAHIVTAGEQVIINQRFKRFLYESRVYFHNHYGPSEAHVVTALTIEPGEVAPELPPIGRPVSNTHIYILDRGMHLVPIDLAGELVIGGMQVGWGYLNNPELTAEKFGGFVISHSSLFISPPDKLSKSTNSTDNQCPITNNRCYRTGDLAKWMPDGNIEFLGRIDHQVKISGFRIELGEIESKLLENPQVKEVVVIVRESKDGDKYLCAYIVSNEELDYAALRNSLAKQLPDYMIPAYFVRLENIPLTPSGKVDRNALFKLELECVNEYIAPANEVEEKLASIWAEILSIKKDIISTDTNFFELGGHSLKATILVSKIHKELSVKIPLAVVFKNTTIRGLSRYIESTGINRYAAIEPVEEKEYYPLAPAQKRLYILQQFVTDNTGYNMPYVMPLGESVEKNKMESVFKGLIERHESLRTSFITVNEEPAQRIYREVDFSIGCYEIAEEAETISLIPGFTKPFDLSKAPLLRVNLVTMGSSRRVLFIDMHHIITDGTSQEILEKEFMALYSREELSPLRLQYKDYSEWQNNAPHQEAIKHQENYWMKEFSDEIPVLHLATDYPRPLVQSFEGNVVSFILNAEETQNVKIIAKQNDATLYMCLLAVFTVLLSKLSGQEDIIIGTPIAARRHADLQDVIGMLVNTLAMRNYPSGDKMFGEFLKELKQRTLEAYENQEYPFEELVDNLTVNRDTSRNPVFDVMFNLLNLTDYKGDPLELNDPDSHRHIKGTSKFDMGLTATEIGEKIFFTLAYSTGIFKPETIERITGYFKNIVKLLSTGTGFKISGIEILPGEEKKQVLYDFNDTASDYPGDKTIHRLFEEQVKRTPERIAVVGSWQLVVGKKNRAGESVQLTYRELNEKSHQLACFLRLKGVTSDHIIGIMVERSIEMIVGIMGILKSDAAYLPIDPGYPQERVNYMLADSKAEVLVTTSNLPKEREKLRSWEDKRNLETVFLDGSEFFNFSTSHLLTFLSSKSSNLAYVIYTSGTTGKPKGVMVEHSSVVNLVCAQERFFKIEGNDRVLQFSSICFDASVEQIFMALSSGALLVLVKESILLDSGKFERWISLHRVTHLHAVPSFLVQLKFKGPYHLKRMVSGGDTCPAGLAKEWNNHCHFCNKYGPTETTVTSIEMWIDGVDETSPVIPIGKPVNNTRVYMLGSGMNLVPIGAVGELYIGGVGVARGYLNRPELTAEKFVLAHSSWLMADRTVKAGVADSPMSNERSAMSYIYKTDDLARWLPDGNIEFLGRTDTQVKIRGFRVEMGEIENRLLNHPGIKDAVVSMREEEKGDKYLCAYIVSDCEPVISELREYLAKELPDYMIPSYFARVEKIPLTPNGKIDRKALPKPELKPGAGYVSPREQLEEKLVEIWVEVLGGESWKTAIGIDENFFELGGHSLKATILVSKIHKELSVKIPLAEVFKNPTVRGLSKYIKGTTAEGYESIIPVEKKEYYVLSSSQKRLYILQQMGLASTVYNMPEIIPLAGESDWGKIEETFTRLIKRHQSLRTSFHLINDTPVQKIHDNVEFEIEYKILERARREASSEPLRAPPSVPHASTLNTLKDFVRPFDLSQVPLLRVGLVKKIDGSYILLVDMHHIISDGVSHGILLKDFQALYKEEELPPLRGQYKDFSQWQNREQEKKNLKRQEEYWLKEFEGEIPVLELPTDYPRPVVQSFEGDNVLFEIFSDEFGALKAIALSEGSTLFMVLVVVMNILLSKLSGQEEIIIGIPIAGRRNADLDKIIGMFVNTLSLRNYPAGNRTFREFLGDVKEKILMAFENQEYPFEELVDKLSVKRDIGRNPLFDIMLVLQNMNTNSAGQDKKTEFKTSRSVQPDFPKEYENIVQTVKFDLTISAVERDRGLFLSLRYSTKLFKKETIERFIIYFKKIVSKAVKEPGIRLSEIEVISEEEKKRILYDFNDTEAEYPKDKTIHRLFEEQVERTPENIAVVAPSIEANHESPLQITYKELNEKSNLVAHGLQKKGVGPDTNPIVGIMVERSIEMISGILGILKSGGAYLPIDPEYPKDRIDYMLKDSGAKILVTENEIKEWLFHPILTSTLSQVSPAYLAYVIYTSGTTGNPKGVMIQHQSVVNYISWAIKHYVREESVRFPLFTSLSFDLTVTSIFAPLLSGNTIVVYAGKGKESLIEKIVEDNLVEVVKLTPSHLKLIVELVGDNFQSHIKRFVVGGESLATQLAGKIVEKFKGDFAIYNEYGPTEATVGCMIYLFCHGIDTRQSVPIGIAADNARVFILAPNRKPVPVGVVGELYISGDGVARGYLNRPELTAEKFFLAHGSWLTTDRTVKARVADSPMSNERSAMSYIYKTDDLARWLPDGNVEFLGRTDTQVKIRGFRIELGEIESRLLNHERIKESVVLAREEEKGDKYLCAYIVSDCEPVISELREYLSKGLPDYMIPSYFVPMEKIPLTSNGKLDRRALPEPELKAGKNYVAPRDQVEEKLVEIWNNILNPSPDSYVRIGIDDNFFELGGHSLKAVIMSTKISREFNTIVPLIDIFNAPNIRKLADYLKNRIKIIEKDIDYGWNLVLLKEGPGKDKHLFFIHDGSGEVEGYVEFCNHITNEFNCWGLRADRLENLTPRNVTTQGLAKTYIETMKKIQPHGPYYIAGWSLGGIITFEIAAQLEQTNEEIAFLALFDSPPPDKNPWKNAGEFNLKSELNFIKNYDIGSEIDEKLKKLDGIDFDQFWSFVADYLKTTNFKIETVKKIIIEQGMRAFPNYDQLGIREFIYSLNIYRTLINARERYIPAGKINTQAHYFKATQSKGIKQNRWNKYCRKSIKCYRIPGDHFSIFKTPDVVKLTETFVNVLDTSETVTENNINEQQL